MKQRRQVAFSFFAAIIVLFFSSPLFAQWKPVLKVTGGKAYSGFFFNELVGFIGGNGNSGIYKTTDGGNTWAKGNIPAGYSGGITQVYMTDSLHGWATIEDMPTLRSILRTVDGGKNWTLTGPVGSYNNIYETPSAVIALSRNNYPGTTKFPTLVSTDGGATFQSTGLILKNGIDFADDLNGVMTSFTDSAISVWMKTGDGGRTWAPIVPNKQIESWSVYAVKGTSIFYAAPEDFPGKWPQPPQIPTSKVMRSTDFGNSWSDIASLSFLTTGHIAGVGENLYVQVDNERSASPTGLFRSTDRGASWQPVNGPSNDRDTRFCVTGCNGGVVYAFDVNGNVYKTRNGGDGQIYEPPLKAVITGDPIVFSSLICATNSASLKIQNLYCSDDTVLSAEVLDTTSDLFKSGALTISVMPSFPLVLAPNSTDSIRFIWQPSKLFHTDTTLTIQVRVRYYSKILKQLFDTTVTVSVHAIGEPPQASVAPLDLNFGNISYCSPHDTSFIIHNFGCDTLYVLNALGTAPMHYQVLDSNGNPLTLPFTIPPSESDKILIRLNLDSAGSYSSDLLLTMRHQGILKDTTIHIAGSISTIGSYFIPDSVDFGAVSTCRIIDSLLVIRNLGCTIPLVITSAILKNNTVFSLGAPPYTPTIAPNTNGNIHLKFAPNSQAPEVDELTLLFTALGEVKTKTIYIKGSGILNPPKFITSLATDTLFNISLTRCDSPKVFPVILSNPGCKNITIKSAQLQGTATPDIILALGENLPKDISDTANANLKVTVSSKDLGTYNGFLHITYLVEGDNSIHDTLLAYFLTVTHGTRILSVDHDSIYLGTFKLCESRDSVVNIANPGCDILDILSIKISGQGNFVLTPPNAPGALVQNQTGKIGFHFDPTQAGFISGTMVITSVSDTLPVRTVTITADIIPTDTMTFSIAPSRQNFHAGDTLSVVMTPQQNVHNKGLYSLQFTLNYNGDLLTFLPNGRGVEVLTPNIAASSPIMGGTPKHTTATITLVGNPSIQFDSLSPALIFHFSTSLTDSISTSFELTDIKLNGGDAVYQRCELGILSASLSYQMSLLCGDSTLVRFLQLGNKLRIFADAVYPNPLNDQNNFQGHVPFTTDAAGVFELRVFDQLGRSVSASGSSPTLNAEHAGSYEFTIDGRSLAAGCYTYLLEEITGSSSAVRGRFIVTK